MDTWFSGWAVWFLVALLAAIVEIVSPTFGFIFVSGAALVSFLVAALGAAWFWQLLVFAIAVVVGLLLVRPRLNRMFGSTKPVPSRAERLLGLQGVVTEEINPIHGTGRVLVGGEDWSARSMDRIPVGTHVVVDHIEGIVLIVAPLS